MLKSFGNEEREGGHLRRLPLLIQPFLKEVEMIGMRFVARMESFRTFCGIRSEATQLYRA